MAITEVINIHDGSNIGIAPNEYHLQPFDVITIRRKGGYEAIQSVSVSGAIQYPELYAIETRDDKISDLVIRAGGFAPYAYVAGASLRRKNDKNIIIEKKNEVINKIQKELKDSSGTIQTVTQRDYDIISLNLARIMEHPGSIEDMILQPNDELIIPKREVICIPQFYH